MTAVPCLLTVRVVTYGVNLRGWRLAPGCFDPDLLAGMLVPFTRRHGGDPIGWAVAFRDHPDHLEADLWVPDVAGLDRWLAVSIAATSLEQRGPMTTKAAMREIAHEPKGRDPSARILAVEPTTMRVDVPLASTPTARPGFAPEQLRRPLVRPAFLDEDEIADYWSEVACA